MLHVLIRGGGDLATGTALRLDRAGFKVVITELAQPLAVRRAVSFAEAVYEGEWKVEDAIARRVDSLEQALALAECGIIPVLIAPQVGPSLHPDFCALVDARMIKRPPETDRSIAPLVIGLGPGFSAGDNCHAVVETRRGHTLGRVYWRGSAVADTSMPDGDPRRVLRAPADGVVTAHAEIGQHVVAGQLVAKVGGLPVTSPFCGVVHGLIRPGLHVSQWLKIGDVDRSGVREHCFLVSDKALAVAGGVLEAILSRAHLDTRG